MKVSKTVWLLLGIGSLAIMVSSLGTVYSREADQQQELSRRLSAARSTLPGLISQRDSLQSALTQASSRLAAVKARFPNSVDSADVAEKLGKIVGDCGLNVLRLSSAEPSGKKVKDVNYSITPFAVTVQGKVSDIVSFVKVVATGEDFASATLEQLDMRVPEPLTDKERERLTEEEIEEKEKPQASLKLLIYGYRGN